MIKDIYNHFKDKLPNNRIDIIFDKAKTDANDFDKY